MRRGCAVLGWGRSGGQRSAACLPVQSCSNLSHACALMSFWFSRSNSPPIRLLTCQQHDTRTLASAVCLRDSGREQRRKELRQCLRLPISASRLPRWRLMPTVYTPLSTMQSPAVVAQSAAVDRCNRSVDGNR
jgi:hypothetical protein